ncbi:hypothetical protein E2C01_001892 [Portunus trituberculatus]|uniref:Uncharacterized protein n=1 Tax=Portunus trituberculatus TaxID=210409 RepID=A0A5B7CIE4_PORTR|nr:hypothetical protein [Portunus trituberculatus]
MVLGEVVEVTHKNNISSGVLRFWEGCSTKSPKQWREKSSSIPNLYKGLITSVMHSDGGWQGGASGGRTIMEEKRTFRIHLMHLYIVLVAATGFFHIKFNEVEL